MKRTNFAFRYEWSQAIAHLSPDYRLEILEATIRYAETGETGPLSDVATEAFNTFILPDFERRRKAARYRAMSKARKEQKCEEKSDNQATVEIHPTPNRRERRRLLAEEKRLQKKRRRRKTDAQTAPSEQPQTIPPAPPFYTPYWL